MSSPSDSESEGEIPGQLYALHNAAESGDVNILDRLLNIKADTGDLESVKAQTPIAVLNRLLTLKDVKGCTPLHVAILNGHVACVDQLILAGSKVDASCDGNPPICMAVCLALLPGRSEVSGSIMQRLISAQADVMAHDDGGRTALHWAAAAGLCAAVQPLLAAGDAANERRMQAYNADVETLNSMGIPPPPAPSMIPGLTFLQDKDGNTPCHLASFFGHSDFVVQLLEPLDMEERLNVIKALNKDGCNSLHVAAMRGQTACCGALLSALPLKMARSLVSKPDRREVTAIEMAKSRGHQALHDALSEFSLSGILPSALQLSSAASSRQDLLSSERLTTIRPGRYCDCTLILAPEECLLHHTAPHPLRRGANPPPENEDRLRVLTNEATGILRCTEFKTLMWETQGLPSCTMSDILRCHDWSYVQSIMQACMEILDHPLDVGHLDSDTAISHHSYLAALKAAGAVCAGVDRVMSEQARNVFCAVRPPGHHAGPSGKCTNENDPHGSHGFCLFSNVAIGAAYAMNVYRHQGVKKVALLDFDVHHGNGTEAVVANTFPSVQKVAFTTPYSDGVQKFPMYKPWLDSQDEENIFFASVQGYGHRSPLLGRDGGWFYPGSGCTADTKPPSLGATAAPDDSRAASAASQDTQFVHQVKEDPDGEFTGSTADQGGRKGQGPRIINVGVPGPGSKRQMWRRAWRDKILPALFNFQPDLIIVSAGFDAHKKEDLNLRYVGVTEQDYEWLTGQIVEMANRFCKGRIVSVLEGGYNLRGGLVSAFARSVAAHVRALADGSKRLWDPSDSEKEREMEARAKLKQLSSLQQNIEVGGKLRATDTFVTKVDIFNGSSSSPCLPPALPVVSATTASVHNDVSSDQNAEMASGGTDKAVLGGGAISAGNDNAPCKEVERMQGGKSRMEDEQTRLAASHLEAAHAKKRDMSGFSEAVPSPADAGSSKRSRRGQPVDYVALNAKLEAETRASK